MPATDVLDRARDAFARRAWTEAYTAFTSAEELGLDDLERLAVAAYLIGEEEASADAWTRAHQRALDDGAPDRAARCAFWHAVTLIFRGEMAPGFGWIERGRRVLEDSGVESAERAWAEMLMSLPVMFGGDPAAALPAFQRAGEVADHFDDKHGATFARLAQGQCLVMMGDREGGFRLLDEVMATVMSGEVSPILCGLAYCAVIEQCQMAFDVRRAREWTAALSRWCAAQPDLVPYRGNCLIHRCEIFRLHGDWGDAVDAAERACDLLSGPRPWDALGAAYYHLAELHRLRGRFDDAERSYREASKAGRDPEPGMSSLRLAQGRTDVAAASIGRAVAEEHNPVVRSSLLPAAVEIAIAAGDIAGARRAADELAEISRSVGAPLLEALAAQCAGAVLLAEGDDQAALTELRRACSIWRDIDAPHETARARVLIGSACRALGDEETAEMEFDAAREIFESLEAGPDLARLAALAGTAVSPTHGLSPRELEVLRLVASGKTNRAVAKDLVLSEKTVARHVSNIFAKLGVQSRAAATAYAYENDLV